MITIERIQVIDALISLDEGDCVKYVQGNWDDVARRAVAALVEHNFTHADVCDNTTGELLMMIKKE